MRFAQTSPLWIRGRRKPGRKHGRSAHFSCEQIRADTGWGEKFGFKN